MVVDLKNPILVINHFSVSHKKVSPKAISLFLLLKEIRGWYSWIEFEIRNFLRMTNDGFLFLNTVLVFFFNSIETQVSNCSVLMIGIEHY